MALRLGFHLLIGVLFQVCLMWQNSLPCSYRTEATLLHKLFITWAFASSRPADKYFSGFWLCQEPFWKAHLIKPGPPAYSWLKNVNWLGTLITYVKFLHLYHINTTIMIRDIKYFCLLTYIKRYLGDVVGLLCMSLKYNLAGPLSCAALSASAFWFPLWASKFLRERSPSLPRCWRPDCQDSGSQEGERNLTVFKVKTFL